MRPISTLQSATITNRHPRQIPRIDQRVVLHAQGLNVSPLWMLAPSASLPYVPSVLPRIMGVVICAKMEQNSREISAYAVKVHSTIMETVRVVMLIVPHVLDHRSMSVSHVKVQDICSRMMLIFAF